MCRKRMTLVIKKFDIEISQEEIMPKMKTHRGAAKRYKVTAGGKIKRARCNKNHILNGKPRKRKRNLRHGGFVDATREKSIKKMLPYTAN